MEWDAFAWIKKGRWYHKEGLGLTGIEKGFVWMAIDRTQARVTGVSGRILEYSSTPPQDFTGFCALVYGTVQEKISLMNCLSTMWRTVQVRYLHWWRMDCEWDGWTVAG